MQAGTLKAMCLMMLPVSVWPAHRRCDAGCLDQVEQQCWVYWGRVDENLRDRVREIYTEMKG